MQKTPTEAGVKPSEAIPATPGERNRFGLLPCPKCASRDRWPDMQLLVQCDCGFIEPLPDDLRGDL